MRREALRCPAQNLRLSLRRYERLEDQLHDLTDLHQHETANLKQELASIEEKVAYQAYERSRDIQVPCLSSSGARVASPRPFMHGSKLSALPPSPKGILAHGANFILHLINPVSLC